MSNVKKGAAKKSSNGAPFNKRKKSDTTVKNSGNENKKKWVIIVPVLLFVLFITGLILYFVLSKKNEEDSPGSSNASSRGASPPGRDDTSPSDANDGWRIRYLRVQRKSDSKFLGVRSLELHYKNKRIMATGGHTKPTNHPSGTPTSWEKLNDVDPPDNENWLERNGSAVTVQDDQAEVQLDFGPNVVADTVLCKMLNGTDTVNKRIPGKVFEALDENKKVVLSFQFKSPSQLWCQFKYPSTTPILP